MATAASFLSSPASWRRSPRLLQTGRLGELRYRATHAAIGLCFGLGGRVWTGALMREHPRLPVEVIHHTRRRLRATLERDLENARAGRYPAALLHSFPFRRFARQMPGGILEMRRVLMRARNGAYNDLPTNVDIERYPAYYRRTFHWQTDGWLSDRSAEIYDFGVEFLFAGTANIMRRMAIPPLTEHLAGTARPRVLDVGTGTGAFLEQLCVALPNAELTGVDLSPFYVRHARTVVPAARFEVSNGERLPYESGAFDAVSSVFLFHELPKDARRRVVREMIRVLRPGGRVVICDSAQVSDAADILPALENFPRGYHEPYYKSYIRDDLADILSDAGLLVRCSEPHLVSKVVVADKV
ncbi:MAG: class I SAM-dependent methyltransferase [Myxococcota bacterium]